MNTRYFDTDYLHNTAQKKKLPEEKQDCLRDNDINGSEAIVLIKEYNITQHKINFAKNCPQWDLNSQPLDHQSTALPTVLSWLSV